MRRRPLTMAMAIPASLTIKEFDTSPYNPPLTNMKNLHAVICCGLLISGINAFGQESPRLAIVAGEIAPTLLKKYPKPASNPSAQAEADVTSGDVLDFQGNWNGTWLVKGRRVAVMLHVEKSADKSLRAEIQNVS